MSDDPLLSAQRSLLRVAVVAVALVAAAGVFARCARERAAPESGDAASPSALVPAVERALEPRLGPSAGGAEPTCAAAVIGEGPCDGGRRRLFVLARCQQLCLRDGVVASGALGMPFALGGCRVGALTG